MVINQGDVFWIDLEAPVGSMPGYRRPHVVIQNNNFNHSGINTVVLCAITSTVRLARSPGNVLLQDGEANLSKRSVVNISQIVTVNKVELQEKIGTLSSRSLQRVLAGIHILIEP